MTNGGDAGGGNSSAGGAAPKKKQRVVSSSRASSTIAVIESSLAEGTIIEGSHKPPAPRRTSSVPAFSSRFNDSATADVILRLYVERFCPFEKEDAQSMTAVDSADQTDIQIYLHSDVLSRSKYFSALLSDRWRRSDLDDAVPEASRRIHHLSLGVPDTPESIDHHLTVLQLLYANDFSDAVNSVPSAVSLLHVALQLLFEDCIRACVRFLEAVPWSEEEEKMVLKIVPFLREDESHELLSRVSMAEEDSSEEMLHGLILTATNNHPNMALAKAFVAKLLRDFPSKESVRRVLDRAFEASLKVVKESLEAYLSPDFRGWGDHHETEAIQRLNLHNATTSAKHLLWFVERMIELKVADRAGKEWSNQASFTADLQRAFRDDAWRNIAPGLPAVVLRCTCKLANAVATGTIIASRQDRLKLVKNWLPVLIICKDNVSPMTPSHKSLYPELEETFLRIISTLPMSEAQVLLQQCLSFSTRNVEDCPHLVSAFTTWFRRANRCLEAENLYQ